MRIAHASKPEAVSLKAPVERTRKAAGKFSFLSFLTTSHISKKEKEFFVENFTLLITSVMDVLGALEIMKLETSKKYMKKIIQNVIDDIVDGSTLWRAFENMKIMPSGSLALLKIGEESGRFIENMKVIVSQHQKHSVFRQRLRSAMLYPTLIFIVALVVGVMISWIILPRLSTVFYSLDIELPLITRWLIAFGDFLGVSGSWFIPTMLVFTFLFVYFLFFFRKTKILGQKFLFRIGLLRKLIMEIELARMGYTFGVLLNAGIPIVDSIRSLIHAGIFPHYLKFYMHLAQSIEDGNTFQQSFRSYRNAEKIIPISVQQLIIASERSGSLSETLLQIGQRYEEKIEISTKNLTTLLEPILLIIVWLMVVGIAVAIILPIYSLIGNFDSSL